MNSQFARFMIPFIVTLLIASCTPSAQGTTPTAIMIGQATTTAETLIEQPQPELPDDVVLVNALADEVIRISEDQTILLYLKWDKSEPGLMDGYKDLIGIEVRIDNQPIPEVERYWLSAAAGVDQNASSAFTAWVYEIPPRFLQAGMHRVQTTLTFLDEYRNGDSGFAPGDVLIGYIDISVRAMEKNALSEQLKLRDFIADPIAEPLINNSPTDPVLGPDGTIYLRGQGGDFGRHITYNLNTGEVDQNPEFDAQDLAIMEEAWGKLRGFYGDYAISPDGVEYRSYNREGRIVRINPDGTETTVVSGLHQGDPIAIEFGPDGLLYIKEGVYGYSRVSPEGGTPQTIEWLTNLQSEFFFFTDFIFLPDGDMLLSSQPMECLARVSLEEETIEILVPCALNSSALTVSPDGDVYVGWVTEYPFNPSRVVRIGIDGSQQVIAEVPGVLYDLAFADDGILYGVSWVRYEARNTDEYWLYKILPDGALEMIVNEVGASKWLRTMDFDPTSGTFIVFDNTSQKVLRLSKEGEQLESFFIPAPVATIHDGRTAVTADGGIWVVVTDLEGFYFGPTVYRDLLYISPDGRIEKVADLDFQYACCTASSIAVGPEGDAYVAIGSEYRLIKVSRDGTIEQLAFNLAPDPLGLEVSPAGEIFFTGSQGVIRLEPINIPPHNFTGNALQSFLANVPASRISSLPTTVGAGTTMVWPTDGMVMVYVPAGPFQMGIGPGELSPEVMAEFSKDAPGHTVSLDAFWIDRTEITNAMFQWFVDETGYVTQAEKKGVSTGFHNRAGSGKEMKGASWRNPHVTDSILGYEQYPVVHVSWEDAQAYCEWAGRSLPSEAEWEKAARGEDGGLFPWGWADVAPNLVNYLDQPVFEIISNWETYDGYWFSAPVGSFPEGASPYGALDMAGNVWEWVADWYSVDYYAASPDQNPLGPETGEQKVIRGGAWNSPSYTYVLSATRSKVAPNATYDTLGFRCAIDAGLVMP